MSDSDGDELGPVDYVVVEFPADDANFSGEMASELSALVERDLVRVLDLLFIKKNVDGSVEAFESHEFDPGGSASCRRTSRCCSPRRTWNRSGRRWSGAAARQC